MLKLIRVKFERWAIKTREVMLLQSQSSPYVSLKNIKPPPSVLTILYTVMMYSNIENS